MLLKNRFSLHKQNIIICEIKIETLFPVIPALHKKIPSQLVAKQTIPTDIILFNKKSCKILTYMHFRINIFVILRSILTYKKHNS